MLSTILHWAFFRTAQKVRAVRMGHTYSASTGDIVPAMFQLLPGVAILRLLMVHCCTYSQSERWQHQNHNQKHHKYLAKHELNFVRNQPFWPLCNFRFCRTCVLCPTESDPGPSDRVCQLAQCCPAMQPRQSLAA